MKSFKTIWVNGCFDILHIGHIRLFEYAKSKGDRLIVGIDSDRRVKELKGESRPFNGQSDRCEMLRAISFIDDVVIFESEDEMCNLISQNDVDLIVVGDDYKGRRVVGEHLCPVDFFTKIPGHSTTSILNAMRDI